MSHLHEYKIVHFISVLILEWDDRGWQRLTVSSLLIIPLSPGFKRRVKCDILSSYFVETQLCCCRTALTFKSFPKAWLHFLRNAQMSSSGLFVWICEESISCKKSCDFFGLCFFKYSSCAHPCLVLSSNICFSERCGQLLIETQT